MFVISPKEPSAVCATEMPSLAFRTAAFKPRISEVMRVVIANPAASSLAELILTPVESRSMEFCKAVEFLDNEFCESNELTLVLITEGMKLLL
jgi:hypothetical protein